MAAPDTDNPYLWKHTVWAVAMEIIELPPGYGVATSHERVRIKHRCRAYARHIGGRLTLRRGDYGKPSDEIWELRYTDNCLYIGSLQQCCRFIMERDPAVIGAQHHNT